MLLNAFLDFLRWEDIEIVIDTTSSGLVRYSTLSSYQRLAKGYAFVVLILSTVLWY